MSIANDQELNRYSISIEDFKRSIEFLKESNKHLPNSLLYESLLICALLYYCRPFSSNEREKNAKATSKINIDSFSDITDDEKSLHNKCMTIRNKALAHSEWSKYPTGRDPKTNVISSREYSILSEGIDRQSLIALVEKLKNQCHHKRADYIRSCS